MYKETFKELVNLANSNSETVLRNDNVLTNPFYIGFGNPNAKILIVGQEKAIKSDNIRQIRAESIENPNQWKYIVDNMVDDINFRFYDDYHFKNPLHPYDGKPNRGNTWLQYQKLINFVFTDDVDIRINSFLEKSFITEINHQVSPKQIGNQEDKNRQLVSDHPFYKSFTATILATGNYLTNSEIESRFKVTLSQDLSHPRQKLLLFKNESENRVVVNTRQLSNDISTSYLKLIAEEVRKYVC